MERFAAAGRELWALGCAPVFPYDMDPNDTGQADRLQQPEASPDRHALARLLIRDIERLAYCHAMLTLDGWERSGGCMAETAFAAALGYDTDGEPVLPQRQTARNAANAAHYALRRIRAEMGIQRPAQVIQKESDLG